MSGAVLCISLFISRNSLPQTLKTASIKIHANRQVKRTEEKKEKSKFCFQNLGRPQVLIKTTLVFGSAGEFNFPTLIHGQNLSVYNVPRTLEEQHILIEALIFSLMQTHLMVILFIS